MTIIYEHREVNNQVLLVQFQFPSNDLRINGSRVRGCSLDKYLSLDVWSQIYAKLEPRVEQYKGDIKTRLKETTIPVHLAQLELRTSWKSQQPFHKEIAYQEKKSCDLCPYVLVVKVNMVSALDKYKKHHSNEFKTDKPHTKSVTIESSDTIEYRTPNGSTKSDVEEYVPASKTNTATNLKYTPSVVLSSAEKILADEYTPSKQSDDDKPDIVTYTPTKINDDKFKGAVKKDLNRNNYFDKKKRGDNKFNNLFGDSGDEYELESKHQARLLRSTNKTVHPTHSDAFKDTAKSQCSLDPWVTSRSKKIHGGPNENGQNDETKRKRKLHKISPVDVSCVTSTKDSEAQKLRKLREEFELIEQSNTVDRIINLKDMPIDEIEQTLVIHKSVLKQIIRKNAKIPDHRLAPTKKDCDYLLILDALVTPEQQTAMYKKLRAEFDKPETEVTITSQIENLLWKYLLPEWALQIFMDKFILSREEAVEHLEKQDVAALGGFDC